MNTSVFKCILPCQRNILFWGVLFNVWFACATLDLLAQGNRVELEILIGNEVGIDQRQAWVELLGQAGADAVRMRSAGGSDEIRVTSTPMGDRELCKLVGQLTARNQLVLPGGTFSQRDVAAIRALIQRIRDDGARVALSEKKAFGLTAEQLVGLHRELALGYNETTKGVAVAEIVEKIRRQVTLPLELTADARRALAEPYLIEDELFGLSAGTVLAAVLRPVGLVAVPQRPQGGEIRMAIVDSQQADEHWPIGWPHEGSESSLAPEIYRTFSLRVENIPLRDVLDAIEKKAAMNFLYDYNSLAEKGIELNDVEVTLVDQKIAYASAVRKLLRSSRLSVKAELRKDEAGKPFFWFTRIR
ncbi:MAG TPA: hypothetical protein PKD64_03680 [Pirellulaceae bacterium]|nr:hypothetical protein [Pirellulaceae bacterium]HMO91271.1 hypothetical protein [Pirellulaceae bacterium]HMP68545.1 hypothetical protein [Pirellulaceae bacterium]